MEHSIILRQRKLYSVHTSRRCGHKGKYSSKQFIHLIVLLVFSCGLVGGNVVLASTKKVYIDTEFVNTDWSRFGPYVVPVEGKGEALSANHIPAGGGQDAYMEVKLTRASLAGGGVGTWPSDRVTTFGLR